MKTRAMLGALGTIVLLVVVLLVIFGFGPRIYKLGKSFFNLFGISEAEASKSKGLSTKSLSNAELAFSSFVSSYEICKNYGADSCLCEQFDVGTIPDGYSLKLERLAGEKTRIELYGNKPTPEKARVIDNDNLCFYQYDKSTRAFSRIEANNLVLDLGNYPYKLSNKIQLFMLDGKNTCFVTGTYETKLFIEVEQLHKKCSLMVSGVKITKAGILDLSTYIDDYNPSITFVQSKDDESSKIIEDLSKHLLNNIGKVIRITGPISRAQLSLERRKNMFNDAYKNFDSNKNGLISDDVYLISIRGLTLESKYSDTKKDYFKVHYLQGSEQSKILAEKISSKLQELDGKLIVNDKDVEKEDGPAGAPAAYRFDFEIIKEENSKDNIGPIFLTCTQSYSNFVPCKENTLIPAVFIEVVEVTGDGHYMFEGHQKTIARKIYEGVKDYLG